MWRLRSSNFFVEGESLSLSILRVATPLRFRTGPFVRSLSVQLLAFVSLLKLLFRPKTHVSGPSHSTFQGKNCRFHAITLAIEKNVTFGDGAFS